MDVPERKCDQPTVQTEVSKGKQPDDLASGALCVAAVLMKSTVEAGGSRQVAAAVASALLRTASQVESSGLVHTISDLVADRIGMIAPSLAAQVSAGLSGEKAHSAKGLVPAELVLDRNVAMHAGFETGRKPSELTSGQKRSLQRGARRPAPEASADETLTLDSVPVVASDTRIGDEFPLEPDLDSEQSKNAACAWDSTALTTAHLSTIIFPPVFHKIQEMAELISGQCCQAAAKNTVAEMEKFSDHVSERMQQTTKEFGSLLAETRDKMIAISADKFLSIQGDLDSLKKLVDNLLLTDTLALSRTATSAVGRKPATSSDRREYCKFFARGACTRGEACSFSHDLSEVFYEPQEVSAQESDDDDDFLQGVVARVRLVGMKRHEFDDRCGHVAGHDPSSNRWKIKLHGSSSPVLIKRDNLCRYSPRESDICPVCASPYNLSSVPHCDCGEGDT